MDNGLITVIDMINELNRFPEDAYVYGYEGEDTGLGIVRVIHGKHIYLDFITAHYPTQERLVND